MAEPEPIGVYGRVSTPHQLDNDRYTSSFVDMTDIVQRYGYRPVLYDEGNRSAASLVNRKVASAMLADVRNGKLRGISAPDIGRLSRDEWLTDGKVIADTLIDAHGILVTRDDGVFDLRKDWDLERFQDRLRDAGKERRRIAKRFWEGQYARGRSVIDGNEQPFSRHRTMFGYRLALVLDANGQPVVTRRGIVKRFVEKDPDRARDVQTLITQLDTQPNLSELYAALRAHGVVGPNAHLDGGWNARAILAMLEQPMYRGEWAFLRSFKSRLFFSIDPRRDEFDLDTAITATPQLAYWTGERADAWRRKFFDSAIDRRVPQKKQAFAHPLIGMLRCPECHSALVGKGKHGYICPGYNSGACGITTIADGKVDAVLLNLLPLMQDHLNSLRDESRARLRERNDGVLDVQLEALANREQAMLRELLALSDRGIEAPSSFTDELVTLGRQRQRLLDEQVAQEKIEDTRLEAERALAALGDESLDILREAPYAIRAQIYRSLFAWVEVRSLGPGRTPARLEASMFHSADKATLLLTEEHLARFLAA